METAHELHQAGRFADAARAYQMVLDQNPDDVVALHRFGVLHQQCGYPVRAVELIRRAIALCPDVAAYHSNLAEVYRSLKQYPEAIDCCQTALRLQPDFADASNNLGLIYHDLGQYEEAVAQFVNALRVKADFASAENNRGTSLLALGRTDEALAAFRNAVHLDPTFPFAQANLGQLLTQLGQPAVGLLHCQEAIRLQPTFVAGHNNLGNALLALENYEGAKIAFAEAIRLEPGLAVAHANLGLSYQQSGQIKAALPYLRRAVELAQDNPTHHKYLAAAYVLEEDWEAAVISCEYRVRLEPENADAHCELGWAYQGSERLAEAEQEYHRALELVPDHLDARLHAGTLYEERGAMAEAEACYRRAIAEHPDSPLPLARLAVLARGRLPDEDRDRLRYHLYDSISPLHRMNCLFALAQVADARGDHAEAAACLRPANRLTQLQREGLGLTYDPELHTGYVDRLLAAFTPELFARFQGMGDQSQQPVFVFGMPRSGTTLVEQVLSSHSQIHGAGEMPLIRRAIDSLSFIPGQPDDLGACLQALDSGEIRRLVKIYQDGVRGVLGRQGYPVGSLRIVDKMPDNYIYLGMIALLFPRATLIHVRRDLRDVAFSCWITQFRSIRWADNVNHLARRCQDYWRLMDHWRTVLPLTIHEVNYQQLIEDFEPEARKLVSACGLDWEPECLQFHQSSRPVRTASVTQVRQPLYRKSIARWKAYEPYLLDLFEKLPGT